MWVRLLNQKRAENRPYKIFLRELRDDELSIKNVLFMFIIVMYVLLKVFFNYYNKLYITC